MPKKPNVTNEAVAEVARQTSDLYFEIANLADDIRAGRCDEIDDPVEYARKFAALARTAADAATVILAKAAMQNDRKELQARLAAENNAA